MMNVVFKTRLVKIGDSYNVRLPKLLLDQLGFTDEIEITVQQASLVLKAAHHPRQGWDEQFRTMAQNGDDALLDGDNASLSTWDDQEWTW